MVKLKLKKKNSPKENVASEKGKLKINFPGAVAQLEAVLHKFFVKKILYDTMFRGRGLEFESYRTFESFDDANIIDWKASLRSNNILARRYIQERDLGIYFIVDVSNSMLFGSGNKLKAEHVAEVVGALSHLISTAGDKVGLVMFNEDVVKILRPSSSKNQIHLFMKFLSDPSLYGGGFDLDKAIKHVLTVVKKSYTIFFIVSDFIKVKKSSEKSLSLIGSRFETVAIMVRDPMDEKLPDIKYQFALQDPYSHRQMVMDPSVASEGYEKLVARQKELLKDVFNRSQIDMLELMTDKPFAYTTATFLKSRSAKGGRL